MSMDFWDEEEFWGRVRGGVPSPLRVSADEMVEFEIELKKEEPKDMGMISLADNLDRWANATGIPEYVIGRVHVFPLKTVVGTKVNK